MTFQVRVYGLPVAQGRPRAFAPPGGGIRMYDPATSKDWKRTVQAQVLQARNGSAVGHPLVEAVRIDLVFHLPRPKSLPKKVIHHTKKPDVDNLVKAVKDALKGVLYLDDSQVVLLQARKLYDRDPGVSILVETL